MLCFGFSLWGSIFCARVWTKLITFKNMWLNKWTTVQVLCLAFKHKCLNCMNKWTTFKGAHANSTDIHNYWKPYHYPEWSPGWSSTKYLRTEISNNVSAIEFELATYANTTNSQLRDHTSALSEMQHNLSSTRQEILAIKSAIEVLDSQANSTKVHLRNYPGWAWQVIQCSSGVVLLFQQLY